MQVLDSTLSFLERVGSKQQAINYILCIYTLKVLLVGEQLATAYTINPETKQFTTFCQDLACTRIRDRE